uniref:trypsin n=1 Tax=Neogobius melanostomus TaxID=47308 RepID=A0A8C6U631_9GOBI
MKKKDKHNHHGRHGPPHEHGPGHPHDRQNKRRGHGRFDAITHDEFFQIIPGGDGGDDDEDDESSDWLYDLQEPEGVCVPNPCLHNGVCREKERGKRKFKCDCPKPFKGKKCPKRCKRGQCGRGECVVTSKPPYYECKCKAPFLPPNCVDYEVCEPNPCQNGGTCVRDGNDFDCTCSPGFTGRLCKVGPDDCYTDDGESYRGNVSETDDGHDCLFWNSHFVLEDGTNPFDTTDKEDGLGPHNYCRNPDGERMPWCFYRKGRDLKWDYCDVRKCDDPTGTVQDMWTATAQKQITRIYGGLKPTPGSLPWQVSVQMRPRNSNVPFSHTCGGVLIESCWVLTAGHCIQTNKDMQVVLGSQDLSAKEPDEQVLTVEEAIRHENYSEKSYAVYNDIALLRLKGQNGKCAEESQFVKTACLPDGPLPDGMECTISGWGSTENSSYGSHHLLEAKVLLINQQKCSQPQIYGRVLDNGMLCAGHLAGGVDSCQGDSGGPLSCEQNSAYMVYGLVSWGDQCGKKNKPGIYTRVAKYVDWIRSKTMIKK